MAYIIWNYINHKKRHIIILHFFYKSQEAIGMID